MFEPLSGYLALAATLATEPKRYSGSWNFGPRVESIKTVKQLADQLVKNWGEGEIIINKDSTAPHEAGLLHLNCDKSNQQLGWFPRWDFDTTIGKTVEWYKRMMAGDTVVDISREQIAQYMEARND